MAGIAARAWIAILHRLRRTIRDVVSLPRERRGDAHFLVAIALAGSAGFW
jgi:hypothetical protein